MFKKIAIDKVVVDKDQFNTTEWNTTYPMSISYPDPNLRTYKNISGECEKKIQVERPCLEVTFKETVEIVSTGSKTIEMELFLDVELSIEEFSWFKLLVNIMGIQSIFLGMTVFKLLKIFYSFFKSKLRNEKITQFLIYLICSIGFTWHTYRIFDLSINGELTYNPDYEISNRVRMPTMIFCLTIDERIDKDHKLTGNYLDQLTSEMSVESLFKNITYLNESNEWTSLNLKLVDRFFFMHLKCFNITINQEYHRRQFHFSIKTHVLKVNFTDSFLKQNRSHTLFFMTKTTETTEFSNIVNLIWHYYPRTRNPRYSAEQSEHMVNYEDHLRFIKRFLSTSYDNHFNDLDTQFTKLKSSGLSFKTLKIPVKKHNFDCELEDGLFEQLLIKIRNEKTRNSLGILNHFTQAFVFNSLKRVLYSDSDFTFALVLVKKTQSSKNDAKLILNLLNVLFWFDLSILDLHPVIIYLGNFLLIWLPIYLFKKITQFLFLTDRWLKKFEQPLYERLKARKQKLPKTHQS